MRAVKFVWGGLLCCLLLNGCIAPPLSEFSAKIPDEYKMTHFQVRQAILTAAGEEDWSATEVAPGVFEARKSSGLQSASVFIAYGYEGFSIEYADSTNMQYNPETDTISVAYRKWVYALYGSIQYELHQLNKVNDDEVSQF